MLDTDSASEVETLGKLISLKMYLKELIYSIIS
jgi:hypothetical protein